MSPQRAPTLPRRGTASQALIAVNKAHFPVTVLGPGRRIGLWLQGCSIGCKGCVSQDTWPTDPTRKMPLSALLAWCREVAADGFDGVTISGGEPFDQPQALALLLQGLHTWRASSGLEFDLLCYSGYPLATLRKKHAALLSLLDALIPEPYLDRQPPQLAWRGSANQPLVTLSPRGERVYAAWQDASVESLGKRMQAMVDGQRVWYVGIPARGDMAALEASCRERGIDFNQVSWRR